VSFANPLPWWAFLLILSAAAIVAWFAYSARNLPPRRRSVLVGLRFVTLLVLVICVMRPVARSADVDARDAVVPVLVDTSRSMGLDDADRGRVATRRIDRVRQILTDRLLPSIGPRFHVEVLAFGETVAPVTAPQLSANARRSDLEAALTAIRDRYHGRAIAGIVLLSDGGDTSGGAERAAESLPPSFALGVGSSTALKDREVLSVTAAEAVSDDSRVDLAVSAVSHGFGVSPIELRLLENGKVIDARRAPVHDHLTHLVDDRGGGRVDQRAKQRQLDHRPLAFRDAHEAWHAGPIEVGQRHTIDRGDFARVRHELRHRCGPHDDRCDDVAGSRRVVVERSEHRAAVEGEADLLLELAPDRRLGALTGIDATTGQCPLTGVVPQRLRSAGQQKARATLLVRQQDQTDRRGAAAIGRDGTALERGEVIARSRVERGVEEPVLRDHRRGTPFDFSVRR